MKTRVDKYLLFSAVALSLVGILFIYSASCYSAKLDFGDEFHYVKTQAIAFVLGLFCMFVFAKIIPVEMLKKYHLPIYFVSLVLLALVFVPHIGVESYGAKRWLNLGFFTIQPSEFAKFSMVFTISAIASSRDMNKFSTFLICCFAGGLVCLLLLLEPNMSITIVVASVLVFCLFVFGARIRHLVLVGAPTLACGIALIFSEPYRVRRLLAFVNPWNSPLDEGYQLIQSYYALGSGGLFGVGLFNSRQKFMFLPFAESDFIMSVIGEEIGFLGVLLIVLLYGIFISRGIITAIRAKDRFSCYLATGITLVVAMQTVMNIAVVCGAVPPTGLPLPFVSAGGSSLVAFMSATGILLNISATADKQTLPKLKPDEYKSSLKILKGKYV